MITRLIPIISFATLLALFSASCDKRAAQTSHSPAAPVSANNNAVSKPSKPDPILTKEPDRYSETITIDVQPPGTPQDNHIPALQFDFVRYGADRRADFQVQSVGKMTYLEHSGLRYLVIPDKKLYVELDPRELAAQLPRLALLTPTSVVDHIKSHSKYENLGVEKINDRPAVKYKFDAPDQSSTFFLDETTGLPVRAEIIGGQQGERIMMEMRDVKLNPDSSLFDIPIGFKKVASQQMKTQVAELTDALKKITDAVAEQMNPAKAAAQASPEASPSASAEPSRPQPTAGPKGKR